MFDIVIRDGHIIDGSGSPLYRGDVGILDERIVAIGKLSGTEAHRTIKADGLVVCPGFIDMHTHSDVMLLANPKHEPKVMQGVTTELLGLDGLSYAPLSPDNLRLVRRYLAGLDGNPDIDFDWASVGEFLAWFDRRVAVNVAYLVPHNALRLETVGFTDRPTTVKELAKMQEIVTEGMHQGAVGFSTGLDYFPAGYSNTEEMVKICEAVATGNGVSVWHARIRDLGLIAAIKEVIDVAAKTGVRAHISHYAVNGTEHHGKSGELLAMVDEARGRGLDITFDSYPYTASSSLLLMLLPRWLHEGGPDVMLNKLGQPKTREKIYADMRFSGLPWEQFILTSVSKEKNEVYVGKNLVEAAAIWGGEVVEFVGNLLLEEELAVSYLSHSGNEEDVRTIMKHPYHMASSDGLIIGSRPNPRGWGTFARYLGVYSRELGILSLEEAVRHMTAAPTQRLGLNDRGLVKEGLAADLVVFNPQTVIDRATFEEPRRHPEGIEYVVVNGALVVDGGKHTGTLNGRALGRGHLSG